jgi:aryl-alcohol dehydrogenase-like predicted oxidoreductase
MLKLNGNLFNNRNWPEVQKMKYRKLGNTSMEISMLALGTWAFGDSVSWGPQDENESIAAIECALDSGINFLNTSELYGNGYSEKLLGKVIGRKRENVILTTKVYATPMTKDNVKKACEASLKRLNTEYIDIYQIHYIDRDTPLSETLEGFKDLKKQGKIRAVGVCNAGEKDIQELVKFEDIVVNELPYNLIWRPIEFKIKQECIKKNISILCYSPLANGLLTGKFACADEVPQGRARTRHFSSKRPKTRHGEDGREKETFEAIEKLRQICDKINEPMSNVALSWLLSKSGVASVLFGARNAQQVKQNIKAAELKLTPDIITHLEKATEKVKTLLGPNPDMWQSDSRMK